MARPPKQTGFAMDERWREKLRISNIITRLDQAACGDIEMSQTSLAAAKLVLSKVLPDLQSIKNDTTLTMRESIVDLLERDLNGKG